MSGSEIVENEKHDPKCRRVGCGHLKSSHESSGCLSCDCTEFKVQ